MSERGGSWNFGDFVDALDEDMSFRGAAPTEPDKAEKGFMEDDTDLSGSSRQSCSNEKSRKAD